MNYSDRFRDYKLSILFFLIVFLSIPSSSTAMQVIRFATLAPEGSTWMNVMRSIDEDIRHATNGEVGFKFYPNMSMGDENDVIRKIRLGQINGGGFTGFGLGEIAPQVRIFELPYLFDSDEEIDYVKTKLTPRFREDFAAKGFILLGWADVGWIYFMARSPVASPKDLDGLKVWMWQGDPLADAFYTELGKTPVSLSVTDVRLSLQTGMIDAVYGSPLSTLVLQWFTKLKYISDIPFTNACGAVLMDKKSFDQMKPEHQQALMEIAGKRLKELAAKTREDNRLAYKRLQDEGLQVVNSTEAQRAEMRGIGYKVQNRLIGKLYSRELLDEVLSTTKEAKLLLKKTPVNK